MYSSLISAATAFSLLASSAEAYISYSTVTGFFLQDETATTPTGFDYTATNFGLETQVYDTDAAFDPTNTTTQWQRFENKVNALNLAAPVGTEYKLLFLGRHGEGYHNVAETFYGTPAWNCYWSELDGNGTSVWSDAAITPNGYAQAVIAHNFWQSQIANQKQSLPQSFYSSPMSRCLSTASITFGDLTPTTFSPLVKEYFREGISMHTCDRRSNRTWIATTYPNYRIEAGFTEYDELWKGFEAETSAAQDVRSKIALDSVFSTDASRFISVTSHSGEIGSILRVLGHRTFSLATGAVIPVLVKAVALVDNPAPSSIISWSAQATCTVPPITSNAGGCVCPTATSTTLTSTTLSTSPATTTSATSSSSIVSYSNSTTIASSSTAKPATTSSVAPGASSTSTKLTTSSASSTSTKLATSSAASTSSASTSPAASTSSASPSTTAPGMTTSTVYTTSLSTVTKCPATVQNCPVGSVVTSVIALYTTVCPVSAVPTTTPKSSISISTSVVYSTTISTILSCPPSVTNCPIGKVTTSVIVTTITTAVTVPVAGATSKAATSKAATTPPTTASASKFVTATTSKAVVTGGASVAMASSLLVVVGAAVAVFLA